MLLYFRREAIMAGAAFDCQSNGWKKKERWSAFYTRRGQVSALRRVALTRVQQSLLPSRRCRCRQSPLQASIHIIIIYRRHRVTAVVPSNRDIYLYAHEIIIII